MRIDTLANVKNQLSAVVENLGSEPLFITRNGKLAAVIQAIADDEVDDYLLRNSPRFWRLIEARREEARQDLSIPFNPAKYQMEKVRRKSAAAVREKSGEYKEGKRPRAKHGRSK
jgi:PHD/YefM family antitoxin component YafN of YafNO toxin-antitoxin module